ncbi:MAG: DegT/DnrJ/EryC1/StrS family aminotransferase [Pirellulales bacterium]|nr:DegT/DnrJ/EryC1/StrS family aminotransferase [Pirellulales bacterium]
MACDSSPSPNTVWPMTDCQVPMVDLRAQHDELAPRIEAAMRRVIASGNFILGEEVEAFEREFASFCGARFAIGVSSGLAALELALEAVGVGPGDEVITVANTFVATALAIHHRGATPVLVDVDEQTALVDPAHLLAAITGRTKAILPVHLYGQMADMEAIGAIARAHDLAVVEDACQAHGAAYRSARAGTLGDAGCFSFYPTKNLGALGDGGLITTSSPELAERLRTSRNYGHKIKYVSEMAGRNERLDPLQAAVLRVKLQRLDDWNHARRRAAALYDELLQSAPVGRPVALPDRQHAWHLYVIRAERRDELAAHLAEHGIVTGVHYPVPVHRQPALASYPLARQSFPVTERLAGESLSLPMHPHLTDAQIRRVCASIEQFYSQRPQRQRASLAEVRS